MTGRDEVVGVVPAAGTAARLGSPGASKELTPAYVRDDRPHEALPVCYRLLDAFHEARIPTAYVVSASSKSDLRQALGEGGPETPGLHHVELRESPSPAFSVAAATRPAGEATIALGFPDVLWQGDAAFERLLARLDDGADVALGLFPPAPDYPTVAVAVDARSRVLGFRPREQNREDPAWMLAVWRPVFSRVLEREVDARYGSGAGAARIPDGAGESLAELGLTEVLTVAIEVGLTVVGERVSERPFFDIGEPHRLAEALRRVEAH